MTITEEMRIRMATRPTTVNTRIASLLFRLPGEVGEREGGWGEESDRERIYKMQLKQYNIFSSLTDALITHIDHSE